MLRVDVAREEEGVALSAGPLRPTGMKLPNAKLIWPLVHGDGCVGLSGIYAIINGIRLALAHRHHFTAVEIHELMSTGLRLLHGRLTPHQSVLTGLRVGLWKMMAEAIVHTAHRRTGSCVRVERAIVTNGSRASAFDAIEAAIASFRVPLILCRGGHYTAVSGFTSASILLFDSGDACWIAKRACAVPGDGSGQRHLIHPSSFIAISV